MSWLDDKIIENRKRQVEVRKRIWDRLKDVGEGGGVSPRSIDDAEFAWLEANVLLHEAQKHAGSMP